MATYHLVKDHTVLKHYEKISFGRHLAMYPHRKNALQDGFLQAIELNPLFFYVVV